MQETKEYLRITDDYGDDSLQAMVDSVNTTYERLLNRIGC
jgi:hypothetical protein